MPLSCGPGFNIECRWPGLASNNNILNYLGTATLLPLDQFHCWPDLIWLLTRILIDFFASRGSQPLKGKPTKTWQLAIDSINLRQENVIKMYMQNYEIASQLHKTSSFSVHHSSERCCGWRWRILPRRIPSDLTAYPFHRPRDVLPR